MSSNDDARATYRDRLPTLTEDDIRELGERGTTPPPVPITELVQSMMRDIEGEGPRVARRSAAPASVVGVEHGELPGAAAADVLAEIGAAYLARLGSRSHVPFTVMTSDEALRIPLEHWASFVLSLVNGATSVADIVDAASMPEVEALRLLCELREQGIIDVRPCG